MKAKHWKRKPSITQLSPVKAKTSKKTIMMIRMLRMMKMEKTRKTMEKKKWRRERRRGKKKNEGDRRRKGTPPPLVSGACAVASTLTVPNRIHRFGLVPAGPAELPAPASCEPCAVGISTSYAGHTASSTTALSRSAVRALYLGDPVDGGRHSNPSPLSSRICHRSTRVFFSFEFCWRLCFLRTRWDIFWQRLGGLWPMVFASTNRFVDFRWRWAWRAQP